MIVFSWYAETQKCDNIVLMSLEDKWLIWLINSVVGLVITLNH